MGASFMFSTRDAVFGPSAKRCETTSISRSPRTRRSRIPLHRRTASTLEFEEERKRFLNAALSAAAAQLEAAATAPSRDDLFRAAGETAQSSMTRLPASDRLRLMNTRNCHAEASTNGYGTR
jgi:hypothetical protein